MVTEINLLLQLKNNVYVRNTDFGMLPLFESVIPPQSNPIASKEMVVELELLENAPNIFSPNSLYHHSTEEEKYMYIHICID